MTARAHLPRRRRRRAVVLGVIAILAAVVAVAAFVTAARARPVPDESQRDALLTATRDAVTALMTFAPADGPADRAAVATHLAPPLLQTYRSQGPDAVLAGAVETGATMSVRVVGVGVNTYADDQAQVLVFADPTIRVQGVTDPEERNGERTPTARWATMRNVDGHWRLADLDMVGDVTR